MKNVEGQNNDRSFISTQKRSSRFVLQVNRGSNADPAQVQRGMPFEFCFSTDLHSICFVRALEKSFWTDVFDALGYVGQLSFRRTGLSVSCARFGQPLCPAVRRHARYVRVLDSTIDFRGRESKIEGRRWGGFDELWVRRFSKI